MNHDDQTRRCPETTRHGRPCRGTPMPGRDRCFAHDESIADQRAEARRRGGRNRSVIRRIHAGLPDVLGDTVDLLVDALEAVHAGRMAASRGQAVAALGRAVATVYAEHEVEARLAEVERILATGRHLRGVS